MSRGALREFASDCEGGATREERCCNRGSGVLNKEKDDWNALESELIGAICLITECICIPEK